MSIWVYRRCPALSPVRGTHAIVVAGNMPEADGAKTEIIVVSNTSNVSASHFTIRLRISLSIFSPIRKVAFFFRRPVPSLVETFFFFLKEARTQLNTMAINSPSVFLLLAVAFYFLSGRVLLFFFFYRFLTRNY